MRDGDGRWLAGRRAAWLATWPGAGRSAPAARSTLENPVDTLARELREEWSVEPERVQGEALVLLPHQMVMFVGQAWVPSGAEVERDHEHDDHAWWPADVGRWPDEADEVLRRMARMLDAAAA